MTGVTPSYSDKNRFSITDLLMPIFAGWLLIQGFAGGGVLPVVFALSAGAYLFYTRHRRYDIFEDALVVRYLAPRTLVVFLSEIQDVRLLRQPLVGQVLLIQRKTGSRLIIKPADSEEFHSQLTAALGK